MKLGLTAEQRAFRVNAIGGSDANTIMGGDDEKILRLWGEKRGEVELEDLSDVLPVQMGSFTEPFNRYWFERKTGRVVTHVGDERLSFDHPFMASTLDGLTDDGATLWEAKHVNAFSKEPEVVARYTPQLHHNMIVTGTRAAVLSVFYGTLKYAAHSVRFDPMYAEALIEAEARFWACVKSGERPVPEDVIAPPVEAVRIVDMTGSNSWASAAYDWIENRPHAEIFMRAIETIKKLVEPDVQEASGHGVVVTRSKAGALTIKATKKAKA